MNSTKRGYHLSTGMPRFKGVHRLRYEQGFFSPVTVWESQNWNNAGSLGSGLASV